MREPSISTKTRRALCLVASLPLFLAAAILPSCGGGAPLQPPAPKTYTLVWSDEFNGPDGSAPDPRKWTYDLGGKGWGNNELECYTNRAQNVQIQGGNLVITAQLESTPFAC